MKRPVLAVLMALGVAIVGVLDYATGPDVGFSLFYLVPIAIVAWRCSRSLAVAVALEAGFAWMIADLLVPHTSLPVSIWNASTRFVIYVSQAWMLSALRREREVTAALLARERFLARIDSTTELLNARAFSEFVAAAAQHSVAEPRRYCLLYVDLDNFKLVNDHYGHAAGDDVLRCVSSVILKSIRATDVAARLGGDEFAVLLEAERPAAEAIAARIVDAIALLGAPYPLAGLGGSAGLIPIDGSVDDPAELLARADQAMYSAKRSGKGRLVTQR